jgi:hypothetical protein
VCGNTGEVRVKHANYRRFLQGLEVQVAFPDLDVDQRELLISGTHAHCWIKVFGEEQ